MKTTAVSSKSYFVAVVLSSVFGILGVHFFYLGRFLHGVVDLGLSICGLWFIVTGQPFIGASFLFVDWLHTLVVTIRLLIGIEHDGEGKRIPYPGQRVQELE